MHLDVVDDVGTVINPLLLHGQVDGGIAMGVGQVLMEDIKFDEQGQILTGSFMDYAMPRAGDVVLVFWRDLFRGQTLTDQCYVKLFDEVAAGNRLCELNVIEQVANVCQTTIARDAWERGQPLSVHGWIYGLRDGLLRDLRMTVTGPEQPPAVYQQAIAALARKGVQVKVLTGDNEIITRKICHEVQLDPGEILLGAGIARMSDVELAEIAGRTTVFAKLNPAQKERVVRAQS